MPCDEHTRERSKGLGTTNEEMADRRDMRNGRRRGAPSATAFGDGYKLLKAAESKDKTVEAHVRNVRRWRNHRRSGRITHAGMVGPIQYRAMAERGRIGTMSLSAS